MNEKVVFGRLDRVVANPAWLISFKDAYVENLPIIGSVHGPILLSTDGSMKPVRFPPFRVEAKWLLYDSFRNLVEQSWKKFVHGSSAFQLMRKTEFLKKDIKQWKKAIHNCENQKVLSMANELRLK